MAGGARRILLAVPNADLLCQWAALMEEFYSVPYAVVSTRAQWDALACADEPNPFLQDAVVITTYDFAAANEEVAKAVPWDLAVFEEANALSAVYQEGNQQAKALKRIAGGAFKLLLIGTPIAAARTIPQSEPSSRTVKSSCPPTAALGDSIWRKPPL